MPSKLRSILDQSEQLVIHLDPAVSTLLLCCVVQVNNVWVGCHVSYILLIYLKLMSLARKEQRHNIILYRLAVIPSNSAFGTQIPATHSRHLIAQESAAATVLHRQKSLGRKKSIVVWWGRNAGKLQGSLSLKLDLHCYYHLMVGFKSWIDCAPNLHLPVSISFWFHFWRLFHLSSKSGPAVASAAPVLPVGRLQPKPITLAATKKKEKREDSLHSNTVMNNKNHGFSISIFL